MRTRQCSVLLALLALSADAALARGSGHPRTHGHSHPARSRERTPALDIRREEVVQFVDEVVGQDSLDRKWVLDLLKQARTQPKILEAMSAPAEAVVPWWEYRERMLTQERITKGVRFWKLHGEALLRISAQQEVPPEYLVAILGVETFYGQRTGKFRVLDALATLGFDYPARGEFFRKELAEFLQLVKEDKINPLKATGSYAGAMGAPQFMPSTYRAYALDGDEDHRRDLWNDWEDILASVAHFFKEHGWVPGQPVLAETQIDPGISLQAPGGKLELNETVDSLAARGVKLKLEIAGTTPAVLVPAETRQGPAYRVGFQNFYVITRYNRSVRYAMAVHDLAQLLAQEVRGGHSP